MQWNSPYMTNGYYYAQFKSVSVQCYDPPSGANVQGSKSYIFTDPSMTNLSVEVTNDNTVLKSFLGTGTNMSANFPSGTASSGGSSKTSEVATVPGLSGVGTGQNGGRGDNTTDSGGGSSSGGSGSGSGSGGAATASGAASTGFVQGDGSGGSSNSAGSIGGSGETVLRGSLFAVVVAVVGLCVM